MTEDEERQQADAHRQLAHAQGFLEGFHEIINPLQVADIWSGLEDAANATLNEVNPDVPTAMSALATFVGLFLENCETKIKGGLVDSEGKSHALDRPLLMNIFNLMLIEVLQMIDEGEFSEEKKPEEPAAKGSTVH